MPEQVPFLLGCRPELVDVLASGPAYVVFTVFDCDGGINQTAMSAAAVSGVRFDIADEDQVLRGPVLVLELE